MLNTSNEYKKYIADNIDSTLPRYFTAKATITLADSTVLNITKEDIIIKGLRISDSTSSKNSFQIGSAIINQCILMLNNIEGKFNNYDFTDAVIRPYIGLKLSETTEWIPKGVFTVDEPTVESSIVSLVALDNMNKFDTPFSEVSLLFPCTALQLLQAVCLHCGVSLATVSFLNNSFIIERRPEDEATTCREIVAWVAQLSGNFARCNYNGALELKWYDYFPNALDGNGDTDIVDGNGVTDIVDGNAPVNYHHIYALGSSKIGTDDVVITGIQVKAMGTKSDYGETVLFGSTGYVIEITDNELITENTAATIANSVGAKIVGMQFRQFEGTALADPSREAGDIAFLADKKQNSYQILLSNINYEIGSLDKISSDAETPSRNSSVRYSAQTKAIVKAREDIRKELTAYDIAVITLTESIVNGFGLHQTVVGDEIEGRIIYQHDKPTMEQSVKRWFRTSEGYIQQTRPNTSSAWVTTSAEDIYGNALYNTIIARGVDAEWIRVLTSFTVGSNFSVDNLGNLVTNNMKGNNVDLTGKITATSGSFTGSVTSQNANITGGIVNIVTADSNTNKIILSSDGSLMAISPYKLSSSDGSNPSIMQGSTITREFISGHTASGSRNFYLSTSGVCAIDRGLQVSGTLLAYNDFNCNGTKNRIVNTKNYGEVLLNAYETPRPTFADAGHGAIGEDGFCYIDIDSIFYETIDTTHDYRYFLTKYGQGDLWIDKDLSTKEYFVVRGTQSLEFDWKIEAIQRDYNTYNLEKFEKPKDEETETDYTSLASEYLAEHERELIA